MQFINTTWDNLVPIYLDILLGYNLFFLEIMVQRELRDVKIGATQYGSAYFARYFSFW